MARAFGVIHGRDARATLKVTRRRSVSLKALVVMPSNCYSDQLFAIEDCMRGFVMEGGRFKHARIAGNRQNLLGRWSRAPECPRSTGAHKKARPDPSETKSLVARIGNVKVAARLAVE